MAADATPMARRWTSPVAMLPPAMLPSPTARDKPGALAHSARAAADAYLVAPSKGARRTASLTHTRPTASALYFSLL